MVKYKLIDLPLDIWIESFQYLSAIEVGTRMEDCSTFFLAGIQRLNTPLKVPSDAPTLSVALIQIKKLRKLRLPVKINKILLETGDHVLPKIDVGDFTAQHKLAVDLDDVEISGTFLIEKKNVISSNTATLKCTDNVVLPFQDILLKNTVNSNANLHKSPLKTRIIGQILISGGANNVTLSHLDISCTHDSALTVIEQSNLRVRRCHIHHCGSTGIQARDQSRLNVDQCVVSNNHNDGIKSEGSNTKVFIRSSHLLNNYDGVWCRNGGYIKIFSTWIFNNDANGVRVEGVGSVLTHNNCHIFTNSRINCETSDKYCTLLGTNVGPPTDKEIEALITSDRK